MGIAKSFKETKDYRKKSKRSRSFRIPPLTIHRFSHTIRVDYQKQRAVTKPRNQFHDLFHDIRGRNSFHATRFSTSLSPSSSAFSSSSLPSLPPELNAPTDRPPARANSSTGNRGTGRPRSEESRNRYPNPIQLSTPPEAETRRSLARSGRRRIARRRNTLQGPKRFPSRPSSFASAAVSPPPISTFTRLHTNCTGVYSSFVRLSRCLDRKYRFELSSSFLSFDWKTCLFSDGDAREKTVS